MSELIPLPAQTPAEAKRKCNPRAGLSPGQSPHARANEKLRTTLGWLLKWHYSCTPTIRDLLETSETSYLSQLQKKGYVKSVPAPTLLCGKIWMLTRDGLAAAMQSAGVELPYDLRPESIAHSLVKHTLAAQRAILSLRRKNVIQEFTPERLTSRQDQTRQKRPDVLCKNTDRNLQIAIEIELSPKFARELDMALIAATEGIRTQLFDCVIYVSPHQLTLDRYRETIDAPIKDWWKPDALSKWVATTQSVILTETERSRFYFIHQPEILLGLEQLSIET